uniref:Ubiquitin carboxyl-terminal hydrolase 7 n=1 Tax=Cacopsylla melanoneura TaxID=428564 RepID=A0A8D8ZFI6_9HEMI
MTLSGIKQRFESLNKENIYSKESFIVKNVVWDVFAKFYNDCSTSVEYMGLFLRCHPERSECEFDTSFQLTLLTNDQFSDERSKSLKASHIFKNKSDWGWKKFVAFSTLVDSETDFIDDDSIRVQVLLKINSSSSS